MFFWSAWQSPVIADSLALGYDYACDRAAGSHPTPATALITRPLSLLCICLPPVVVNVWYQCVVPLVINSLQSRSALSSSWSPQWSLPVYRRRGSGSHNLFSVYLRVYCHSSGHRGCLPHLIRPPSASESVEHTALYKFFFDFDLIWFHGSDKITRPHTLLRPRTLGQHYLDEMQTLETLQNHKYLAVALSCDTLSMRS